MKRAAKCTLSVFLGIAMIFLLLPFSAHADEGKSLRPFRISLSIHGDTRTQRGLCWYTESKTDTRAEVLPSDGVVIKNVVCKEWEGYYLHKALITGLTAGTTYSYRVGDGTNWSDFGTFRTDDGDDEVNFITIADIQAGSYESFLKGAETLAAAFSTMPDSDFVANLGDFTNGSDNREWDFYSQALDGLNLGYSIAPVAGNHDGFGKWHWFENMFNVDTKESVQTLNGVNYSFDYGNAHFAVLNTNDVFSVSKQQMKWLENDMNGTEKDWKIVFMHKTPYTLGKDGKWPDALYLQDALVKVVDKCGVDLIMSGHDHMYLRTKTLTGSRPAEGGAAYVLCGTAGKNRYEIRSFLADSFLNTNLIEALTVQKKGYGNYWDGSDWNQTLDTNVGGCFVCVSISGGTLTLNAYILSDTLTDASGNRRITKIDTMTISKETGKNEATFDGDNTTSPLEYYLGVVPSFASLSAFTLVKWLPKFLAILPEIAYVYITEGIF